MLPMSGEQNDYGNHILRQQANRNRSRKNTQAWEREVNVKTLTKSILKYMFASNKTNKNNNIDINTLVPPLPSVNTQGKPRANYLQRCLAEYLQKLLLNYSLAVKANLVTDNDVKDIQEQTRDILHYMFASKNNTNKTSINNIDNLIPSLPCTDRQSVEFLASYLKDLLLNFIFAGIHESFGMQ